MTIVTRRGTALPGAAASGLALLAAAPSPAEAARLVTTAGGSADATAPLVALLSLVAWALAGWLLLTLALTAGSQHPGRLGRACRAAAHRVAPLAVRRGVALALGLSVAVGGAGASPAAASPGPPAAPPAAAPGLDWGTPRPAASADRPVPVLDWPAPPAASAVVVTSGDSLWELAAADLAARTGTAPSDAQVAQAWPGWWAANRDVVGDDPHLIRPGTALTPPHRTPSS